MNDTDVSLADLLTLEEGLHGDPADLAMGDLRALRDRYQHAESGLSYVRRIVQGRLDLVGQALRSRTTEHHLPVEELPDILSQHTSAPGTPRPPQELQPPAFSEELLMEVDDACGHDVAETDDLSDADLRSLHDTLSGYEHALSQRRRHLHDLIDRLDSEVIARYQRGEADADQLLGGP